MVGNLSAMAGKMDVVRPVRHAENWRKGIRSREDRHSEDEGGGCGINAALRITLL
jgi:hypothetical protein